MPENQQICRHLKVLLWYCVIPSGLEPKSSEPESDILSIELWDLCGRKDMIYLLKINS